jgi:threonine dehydrogenase-like Zn-dependent dehydrogenase
VTGVGAGLDGALDCMARFGRVALLGCTRSSDFTIDYYKKVHGPGITLVGAHTMARPDFESHAGWFTHRDDIITCLKLISYGRLDLKTMIKETYKPEECEGVYTRLVNDKNFPILVQFDWR